MTLYLTKQLSRGGSVLAPPIVCSCAFLVCLPNVNIWRVLYLSTEMGWNKAPAKQIIFFAVPFFVRFFHLFLWVQEHCRPELLFMCSCTEVDFGTSSFFLLYSYLPVMWRKKKSVIFFFPLVCKLDFSEMVAWSYLVKHAVLLMEIHN